VRAILKQKTDPTHRRLDDAYGQIDLASFAGYALFLRAHTLSYGILAAKDFADPALSTSVRAVHALLSRDLDVLRVENDAQTDSMAEIHFDTPLHPLGVHYVLAGSHFGKRVLLKRWSRSDDARVLAAGAYLDTNILSDDWPSVLEALVEIPENTPEVDAVIDSALWTFNLFGSCLKTVSGASLEGACGPA
jgi:heme oxygenase